MAPKIKIIDVADKEVQEVKNDDAYTITNDEIKESELSVENEPPETTEKTTSNVEEKDENAREEVTVDTTTTEQPTKKIRNQELVKCDKCQKWVTPKTLKYTHSLKCGEVKKSRPKRYQKYLG